MSEIDKLVNRAYPDELRRVSPIAVDEKAVLARTLDKLGLEEGAAPAKSQPEKKRGRYVGRHEAQREIHLVEVPAEPERRFRWVGWAVRAVAACLLIACAVRFGPTLFSNMLVATRSPAGHGALEGGYAGGADDLTTGGADGAEETAQGARELVEPAQSPASSGTLEEIFSALDQAKAMALSYNGQISILRISKIDKNDQFTVVVHFPRMDQLTVAQFAISIYGSDTYGQKLNVLEVKRENVDGFAYLTYHIVQHNCGDRAMDQGFMQIFYSPAYDTDGYDVSDLDPALTTLYKIYLGSKVTSTSRRVSEEEMEALGYASSSPAPDNDAAAAGFDGWEGGDED